MKHRRLSPRLVLVLSRYVLSLVALGILAFVAAGDEDASAGAAATIVTTGSYSFGPENSWIRVQNIGVDNATLEVDYFDEQGRLAGKDLCPSPTCPPMYPGSGWTFFQRDNPSLPHGFQGSAVVSTDQPIVALLAKDVIRGSKFSIAADTLTTGPGAHQLYLPLTAKRDGPNTDWMGRFAIQNLSDTITACVTITYLSNYADDEVAWEPYKPTMPSPPRVGGCPNGGMPLPPRGTIFRTAANMPVPDRFTGSVRVDLHANAAGQGIDKQFISATADTWNLNGASFAAYRAMAPTELGNEIVLPLVDREVGPDNSWSTHFQIVNRNPTTPAQVTLRFDGFDMGAGGVFVSKTNTVTVKGARMCFQDRDDFANCLGAGDRLPFNFVGTVRLSSTQPIGVVVNRSTSRAETFTNYRGVRPQDGANRVLLPVLNKNYGSIPGAAAGWNSWFRVMVADGGQANVTVRYYGLDLPGGSIAYTVPVDREFTVFQYLEWMLPDGFAGTAILESDRPIVALANLFTDVFGGDTDLLYNGISLQ